MASGPTSRCRCSPIPARRTTASSGACPTTGPGNGRSTTTWSITPVSATSRTNSPCLWPRWNWRSPARLAGRWNRPFQEHSHPMVRPATGGLPLGCSGHAMPKTMPPLPRRLPRRLLMTADAVGGVWDYALELAAGLAAADIRTDLAVMGTEPSAAQRAGAAAVPGLTLHAAGYKLEWMADAGRDLERAADWLL